MKRRKRTKTNDFGAFTLMEILVVLAILGLGLAAITSLTTATSRQAEQVEEETTVQNVCQNIMNSILAGDATVSIGAEIPIPDAPNWTATVELLDGPISSVVAIRITAQRFETIETPSAANPYLTVVSREPNIGRRLVFKEWARRADVRTRSLRRNLDGTVSAVDGTAAETAAETANEQNLQNASESSVFQNIEKMQNPYFPQSTQNDPGAFAAPANSRSTFSAVDAANGVSNGLSNRFSNGVSSGASNGLSRDASGGLPTGAAPTY